MRYEFTTSSKIKIKDPEGKSPEGVYNLIGNAWEWTSSFFEKTTIYDPTQYWNGNPETFIGTKAYDQRGGGWEDIVTEVALSRPDLGTSAYRDLGIRCAADAK